MSGSRLCTGVCIGGTCVTNCNHSTNTPSSTGNSSHPTNNSNGSGNVSQGNPTWRPPGMPTWEQQQRIAAIANNPASFPEVNIDAGIKASNEAAERAREVLDRANAPSQLTNFQIAVLVALGALLAPGGVVAAAGTALTAISIGTVALPEIAAVEMFANAAFMNAATRAGAVLGAGKFLNIFGVFKQTNTAEKVVNAVGKHPLEGWSTEQIIQYVKDLGLETKRDTLLLWTGLGRSGAGVRISEEFAIKNGYTTLEMTPGGKWLSEIGLDAVNSPISFDESIRIWDAVSKYLVDQASGQVNVISGRMSLNSVYMRIEMPAIRDNSKILGVDELQLLPRMIFK